jgi:hypothetical protein
MTGGAVSVSQKRTKTLAFLRRRSGTLIGLAGIRAQDVEPKLILNSDFHPARLA